MVAEILYFILATVVASAKCQIEVPVVQTAFGAVRGIYEETEELQFFLYMGVPYAQHPPGNIFGDSIDPTPWVGILEVNTSSNVCPHINKENGEVEVGTIDCLNANVFVPANRTSSDPLPVFFWLYGGHFDAGSADRKLWGPEFLVHKEIILVSINYRVGPFGFLCLGTEDAPGNVGYKDIVKGLRWVRDNIAGFGGDPTQVTLGGSSSGAFAAEYLIVSPLADGLFNRATLQSGSAFSASYLFSEGHHQHIINMANHFGYKGGSIKGSIQFLQSVEPIYLSMYSVTVRMTYTICLEKELPGIETFMTEIPAKVLESGNYTAVDVLIGFAIRERAFNTDDVVDDSLEAYYQSALSNLLITNKEDETFIAQVVRSFYIGTKPISENVKLELEDLHGDFVFAYPAVRSAMQHKLQNVNVYLFRFEYGGGRDYYKVAMGNYDITDPVHADDLGYLWNATVLPTEIAPDDKLMVDRFTTMFTNFVKYGDPTPEVTELLPVKWLPIQNGGINHFLRINRTMSMSADPHKERFSFWDLMWKTYFAYENYYNRYSY